MNSTARHIWTITKKELRSYFSTPLAWVLIVVFLLLSQGFAFMFGGLLEYQNASLAAFFLYIPWIFMVFAPAVGMRLWSEEHRLGTMEVESALVAHERVVEAAVVSKAHDIKGEAIFAYVVFRGERPTGAEAEQLAAELRDWVGEQVGAIAKPDEIRFTENLPKTRSGKIMRRLLRAIARDEEITQDTSTLENEAILNQLRGLS